MAKDTGYFRGKSPTTSHTISRTPSPRSIPSTSVRTPSTSQPAPLKRPCASCGRKR